MVIAFINYRLSALVFIATVPYLLFLKLELRKPDSRVVLPTWLMGLFFMLFVSGWFVSADTEGWLQIEGPALKIAIFSVWLLLGLTLSVGFVFLGLVIRYFAKRVSFFTLSLLVLPSAWITGEFVRSYLVSLVAYGKGGSLGPFWDFGTLGFAATATPLGYLSRFVGLYGMSLVAVIINLCIFWLLQRKYRFSVITLIVIACLAFGSRNLGQGNVQSLRVGSVQLDAGSNYYYQDLAGKLKSLRQGVDQPLDILALPEYSYFLENGTPSERQNVLSTAFGKNPGLLVYTTRGPVRDGKSTNEIIVSDQAEHIVSRQQKSFLIPTGEYLPWIVSNNLRLFHQQETVDYFNRTVAVAKSPTLEQPVQAHGLSLGVLACSGVVTPSNYRRLANNGADVLINTASLNQFRNATWYHQQARQFARFQAVANNRPFIQSARGGYSFIIDNNGNFLVDFSHSGLQVGITEVQTPTTKTPYTRLGEWTLIIAIAVLASLGLKTRTTYNQTADKKKTRLKPKSGSK